VMNFSTLIATKAARIKAAAGADTVLEFGLRRAQGIDGGLTASRSAYIGGCDASSNVWAGRYYNIPIKGTHAHSWVMAFPSEEEAFEAYAKAMPNNSVFLVDTYDTLDGIAAAILEGKKLRERGHEMLGVRLDSGDLAELSIAAREMLDTAGFPDAQVIASDSLDEYAIADLKARGARIDVWGIGTRLVTAHDQPALGGVYKLAAIEEGNGEWSPRIKLSETVFKVSNPGRQGVRRYYDEQNDFPMGSIIYNQFNGAPSGRFYTEEGFSISAPPGLREDELLRPVFEDGVLVYASPSLQSTRDRALKSWRNWSRITNFANFPHGLDAALYEEKMQLLEDFGFDAL
jgi:nicotinate phosphoribosyltransferase